MKVNISKYPKKGEQKVKVIIERHDTWNMAHELAYIIYPMLLKLKAEKHGVPNDFAVVGGESYTDQKSFEFYEESQDWAFDEKCKQWDEALDKMIWSFEQFIDDEWESKYHHGKHEHEWVECDDLMKNPLTGKMEKMWQMKDKNPGGHWYDHDGHMLHQARIQEGFELFGKYYQNLWD
jgi:hypothetical protein